jgi:hypothetical protein
MGAALVDYDGDGGPDLNLMQYGRSTLYHHPCDGTVRDVTPKAGIAVRS